MVINMFEGSQDFLYDHEGVEYSTYKLTLCDGTLSVYQVIAEPTQNENQLLLTYNLIHSCKCQWDEFHEENSELMLNIIDIIEKHAIQTYITYCKVTDPEDRDIIFAESCLTDKQKVVSYVYRGHIKYVTVKIFFPWR